MSLKNYDRKIEHLGESQGVENHDQDINRGINTDNFPLIRPDAEFVNVRLEHVVGGEGHIGMDINMLKPDGEDYTPGHEKDDPYYGACVMSKDGPKSYYKVFHFCSHGNDFPHGMFIDNQNYNVCTRQPWCRDGVPILPHNWGKRITSASLELYPYDSHYGGARVVVDNFEHPAHGGFYSPEIGTVKLPYTGATNSAKLNGFIFRNGIPIGEGEGSLDFFQEEGTGYTTDTGYSVSGFSSVATNGDGYYSSGPIYAGRYKIYVGDVVRQKKIIIYADITRPYERLDFELVDGCFGYRDCSETEFQQQLTK